MTCHALQNIFFRRYTYKSKLYRHCFIISLNNKFYEYKFIIDIV